MKKPDIDRNRPLGLYLHIPFCKAKCAYCDFHDVCGGSRSTAYALTGDDRASDDQCCYVPQAWLDAGGTRVHPEHGTGIQISRTGEIVGVPADY